MLRRPTGSRPAPPAGGALAELVRFLRGTWEPRPRQNVPVLGRPPVPPPVLPRHPRPSALVVGPRPSPPSASAIQEMVPPPAGEGAVGQPLSQEMRAPEPARPLRAGPLASLSARPGVPRGVSALRSRARAVLPTSSSLPPG